MLNRNIPKKSLFVTVFCVICLIFISCRLVSSGNSGSVRETGRKLVPEYGKPQVVGTITSEEIKESSGVVQSRCQTDVFWTHNDSGDDAFVFALNEKGEKLGTWKVMDAVNSDWEDIATFQAQSGKCFLYLGDIGDNDEVKKTLTIYKVAEPQITAAEKSSGKQNAVQTESAEAIKFSYPDKNHNAETLLVHPQTGEIYVITKHPTKPAEVFKIGAKTEKISDFTVPSVPFGLLTGGEISPDGKRIIICDYVAGYEIRLPENARNFDEIWKQTPTKIELGERKQGEAICYSADGSKIYATSEKKNSPMIRVDRK